MRKFVGVNFTKDPLLPRPLVPLTPLYPDEPCHYIRCNLTNFLVHPDSIIEHCQESQIVFPPDEAEPVRVGKGVRGEITPAKVQAKVDMIEAAK